MHFSSKITGLLTLWNKWDHWWTRKGPPHLIALLRIAFGAYLLFYFGLRLPHVPILFSEAGLVIPHDMFLPENLQFLLIPPSIPTAFVIFGVLMLALLSFTLGCATRTSASIALLLYVYYMLLSFHHYGTSYNRLFLFLLFLFTFSGAGKTFSFEMWRKCGSITAWEPVSVLTQRLIAVQITMTYAVVGWQKVWLPMWQGGEVLYYSFQGMWGTPLAYWFVQQNFPMQLYDFMVFIVKCFEISLPFGLWSRKYRLWFFAGGILFHIGISLFLAAIWWFYAMIACYITFFEPEEVYDATSRLKQHKLSEQMKPSLH